MISPEIINYSLKNLWNRKSRSFLTILSIFIGVATIFIFVSFGLGLYGYIEDITQGSATNKFIVQGRSLGAPGLDDTFKLEDSDIRVIRKTTGVDEATGVYLKPAKIEQDERIKYVFLTSFDPKKPLITDVMDMEIVKGRELKRGDEGKAVLGYNFLVKDKIFPETYDINDEIIMQDQELRVVGFYESVGNPQDDSNVYVINDFVDELYPEENLSYGWIIGQVSISDMDKTIKRVEDNLRKHRDLEEGEEDFFVQSFNDMVESYSSALDIVIGFIILIALVSIIVSAINTANTMITSVLERYKEIGIMKSIGARNSEVIGLFLFESSFLGLVAGIIGISLGTLVTYTGGIILETLGWGFLSPLYAPEIYLGCIAFAVFTGAVSGIAPAINASRINPVDALRYE